jgi:hypothetical protein
MNIKYHECGQFKLETSKESGLYDEDGRDELFLKEFITRIPKEDRKTLSKYIRINFEKCCKKEDGGNAENMTIEESVTDDKKTKNTYITETIIAIQFDPNGWFD